ncbi:hypothetical protein HUK83_14020, partial [Endobacter medicaginis]|nr:hypothetical protein [Endobacter medicaginis]
VLAAMGLDRRARAESLRLSPGRFTTVEDIDAAASLLEAACTHNDHVAVSTDRPPR